VNKLNKDTWKLEDIYQNQEEWENDLRQVETLIEKIDAYQGRLAESADTFFTALDLSTQIQQLVEKVYCYARMRRDEDNSNPTAQALFGRAATLLTRVDTALSFINPEIMELSDNTISDLRQDHRFSLYKHYLEDILRQKPHTLSSAEEQVVARAGEITRTPDEIFKMLNNADLTFPVICDDKGNEIEITKGNFISLMQNKSRSVRRETFQAFYRTYRKLENTFAAELNEGVSRSTECRGKEGYFLCRGAPASVSPGCIPFHG